MEEQVQIHSEWHDKPIAVYWREWDGLRGIVSQVEMEAAKMAGDEEYIKPCNTGQVSGWHVPPTLNSPVTAVLSSAGSQNESQSEKPDQNSVIVLLDWLSGDDGLCWGDEDR